MGTTTLLALLLACGSTKQPEDVPVPVAEPTEVITEAEDASMPVAEGNPVDVYTPPPCDISDYDPVVAKVDTQLATITGKGPCDEGGFMYTSGFHREIGIYQKITADPKPPMNDWFRGRALEIEARVKSKIDPKQRYRAAEIAKLPEDPFWCDHELMEDITALAFLSMAVDDDKGTRFWMRHAADMLATNHICEDGSPMPQPEDAYPIYVWLGDTKDAKAAAVLYGYTEFYSFVSGGNYWRPWRDNPKPLDMRSLDSAFVWYRKVMPEDEIKRTLGKSADVLAEDGHHAAAKAVYEKIGDAAKAEAIAPLAATKPRPSEEELVGELLHQLGAAEAHP